MADVTCTIPINPEAAAYSVGYHKQVSTDLDGGNDVILSPQCKAISLKSGGEVDFQESGNTSSSVRTLEAGKLHYYRIQKIIAATTDEGLGIHVYGD